jgi:hypothetical protein
VNKAENSREAENIAEKLSAVSEKFLSLKLLKLGISYLMIPLRKV